MRHLDLFSGIGGFALAASWVWGAEYENVGHSEIEPFPCKVYHKHFPESECLGDITKIEWKEGQADLITGGFPCQPHSMAGKRGASADERDLWSECIRALRGVRPRHALFENVPGLLTSERGRFFNRVLSDLAQSGYDAEWQTISAASVGAPHRRDRIWIVAQDTLGGRMRGWDYGDTRRSECTLQIAGSDSERRKEIVDDSEGRRRDICVRQHERSSKGNVNASSDADKTCGRGNDADPAHDPAINGLSPADTQEAERKLSGRTRDGRTRLADNHQITPNAESQQAHASEQRGLHSESRGEDRITPGTESWREPWIEVATRLCGMDARVSDRVDRLKALGNGIVPQVAEVVLRAIKLSQSHKGGE